MTVTFLFWNINRRPLEILITNLARQHKVDVLVLAECELQRGPLLVALNADRTEYEYADSYGCEKIRIFTRFPREYIAAKSESHRSTIRHLQLPGREDILLAATHLPSRVNWSAASVDDECVNLSNQIREAETSVGHARTVLVGDLNSSPYDKGVVKSMGLHGVMDRQIAKRQSRTVQFTEYLFFYNPMWGLLGDASSVPPGTHYYNNSEHVNYFWNMYDQVLIRPDLLDAFHNTDLKILNSDGRTSFLTAEGLPDKRVASDHLPILFKLKL